MPLRVIPAPVKYLGSKRAILPEVVDAVREVWRGGTVVDAFSGIATVSVAISEFAPVVCVDSQRYAQVVARALVQRGPRFQSSVRRAKARIYSVDSVRDGFFTSSYSPHYFTRRQALEIDAIRSDVGQVSNNISAVDSLILCALFHGMSKAVAGPGHFAQPMMLPETARERRESIRGRAVSFLTSLEELGLPAAASSMNRAVCADAIPFLVTTRTDMDVVFADPPYSSAQYSRFYHLLETVTRDDSPELYGVGGYPMDRFMSSFGRKREVGPAFTELVQACVARQASLVLTYPSSRGALNGLGWSMEDVRGVVKRHFREVSVRYIETRQSKLGAPGRLRRVEGILTATN